MAYADLPWEVWELVITRCVPSAAAALLATSREVHTELLKIHQQRLQRDRIARAKVQAWLTGRAKGMMQSLQLPDAARNPIAVGTAFTPLLGPCFPRLPLPDGSIMAISSVVTLWNWLRVYIARHNLGVPGQPTLFRMDACLAELAGEREGSVHKYEFLRTINRRNTHENIACVLNPEQWRQFEFNYRYLMCASNALANPDHMRAELDALDPTREYLFQVAQTPFILPHVTL